LTRSSGESVTVRHLIPAELAMKILGKINEQVAPPPPKPVAAPAPVPKNRQAPTAFTPASQVSGNIAAPTTQFSPALFSQLDASGVQVEVRNLDILLDVPLTVTVELGKTHLPIKQILEYGQGSLITLDKLAGEPIDLLVNGKYFAKGEVVVIEENFGVRITSILSPAERIAQLG
jgi:flagellar motor switch protein FliN